MKQNKIAFLGSHGSGKTSLLNYTKDQLEKQGKTIDVFVLGWKNFQTPLMKTISKFYLNSKTKKKKLSEERLERFKQRSWFFYFLYYLELWTRYRKILSSKKNFVLIDRYFYEELISMNKYQYNFFKKLTPKPDFCFILKSSPEIIRQRGHEVTEEKLSEFYSKFKRLKQDFPLLFIDSSSPINQTFEKIKKYFY